MRTTSGRTARQAIASRPSRPPPRPRGRHAASMIIRKPTGRASWSSATRTRTSWRRLHREAAPAPGSRPPAPGPASTDPPRTPPPARAYPTMPLTQGAAFGRRRGRAVVDRPPRVAASGRARRHAGPRGAGMAEVLVSASWIIRSATARGSRAAAAAHPRGARRPPAQRPASIPASPADRVRAGLVGHRRRRRTAANRRSSAAPRVRRPRWRAAPGAPARGRVKLRPRRPPPRDESRRCAPAVVRLPAIRSRSSATARRASPPAAPGSCAAARRTSTPGAARAGRSSVRARPRRDARHGASRSVTAGAQSDAAADAPCERAQGDRRQAQRQVLGSTSSPSRRLAPPPSPAGAASR